jgi:hypothetical protein
MYFGSTHGMRAPVTSTYEHNQQTDRIRGRIEMVMADPKSRELKEGPLSKLA